MCRFALHLPVPYNIDWPQMKITLTEEEAVYLALNYWYVCVKLMHLALDHAFIELPYFYLISNTAHWLN